MSNLSVRVSKPITGLLLAPNSVGTSAENGFIAPVLPVFLTPSLLQRTYSQHYSARSLADKLSREPAKWRGADPSRGRPHRGHKSIMEGPRILQSSWRAQGGPREA